MQRELLFLAVGAALAGAGANALGTYLVASAVDVGIAEGTAGLLAALGSAASLAVRMSLGARADRRSDYGYGTVVALLSPGSAGFVLMTIDVPAPFVIGAVTAFSLGWGWPGLFNLAVVAQPSRGSRRGHRHHAERHLRGRRRSGRSPTDCWPTRSATAAPGPWWPGRRCWGRP